MSILQRRKQRLREDTDVPQSQSSLDQGSFFFILEASSKETDRIASPLEAGEVCASEEWRWEQPLAWGSWLCPWAPWSAITQPRQGETPVPLWGPAALSASLLPRVSSSIFSPSLISMSLSLSPICALSSNQEACSERLLCAHH